jgi:NADH-ubiquinone oxidoreductase chain 1
LVWLLIPYLRGFISFELGLLFFLACTRLGVYTVIVAGWSSNSRYSFLGGLRALAQTVFYEVRLAFIYEDLDLYKFGARIA